MGYTVAVESRLHDSVGAVAWWEVTELFTRDGQILTTSFDNSDPEVREGSGATGAFGVLGALHRFVADQPGNAVACGETSAGTTCGKIPRWSLDAFSDAYVPFSLDATADQVSAGSPPAVVVTAVQAITRGDEATAASAVNPGGLDGWAFVASRDELDTSRSGVTPVVQSRRLTPIGRSFSSGWGYSATGQSISLHCIVAVPAGDHHMTATVTGDLVTDLYVFEG